MCSRSNTPANVYWPSVGWRLVDRPLLCNQIANTPRYGNESSHRVWTTAVGAPRSQPAYRAIWIRTKPTTTTATRAASHAARFTLNLGGLPTAIDVAR